MLSSNPMNTSYEVGALAGMTKYYGQNQTPEKMSDLKL
jgi:hypothetical protein